MSDDDNTMVKVLNNPDDARAIVLNSLVVKIKDLKTELAVTNARIDDLERFQKPMRWIFNKIAAGIGLAIAAGVIGWLGLGG